MKTKTFTQAALGLSAALLLFGCHVGAPTQADLDRVHDDMSPAEVKAILGEPTASQTEPIPVVGGTQTTYTYRGKTSDVVIVFKNDLVKEKRGSFAP